MSKKKHWDYEDDHDYDDDFDYKAHGYVYWYGKYYPKEDIDSLFSEPKSDYSVLKALLAILGVAYVARKVVPHVKDWWTNTAKPSIKKPSEK